ncbi:synaptotagmin-like protein 3 isoform X2 [Myripristis murdjan]|uniref:synaptotagmin-like protein 3 isoform X2 n=1 Tax=Myripristis murdjan TaxID=586833 RepID=UPI0011764330|nr:synaptotagmin-like protein 3 isoform X2 [Myripristis murdjan]
MIRDGCLEMDLNLLQALERETVLEVLQRDKLLRTIEEERIRRMKHELQELRRKGAKSFARQYGERTCARCQRPLGKFWNSGAVCRGCSHRICSKCRVGVGAADWKCTVCHAYREVKIRSGEWFLEERAKRFPVTTERHETVGEKLLKSCDVLSYISIVPPTPPPHFDDSVWNRSLTLKNSKPFTKSMEDLMVSFTSHIKKMSMSQNDVRADHMLLRVDESGYRGQKSLSDTDISTSTNLTKGPSLPNLFKRSNYSDQEGSSTGAEEEASICSEYSGGKRGSCSSISTECGLFESSSVTGELELALTYNTDTSCLHITVSGCRNLTYGDAKRRKCHPYVKIYLLPEKTQSTKLKTTVKRNTTDPVYNEVLKYHIERPLLHGRTLQASVWHSGTLKRKVFLGEALIPLEDWRFEDKASQGFNWYLLCPKPESPEEAAEQGRGEMLVKVKFSTKRRTSYVSQTDGVSTGPHGNDQLTVLIKSAKHLPIKANTSQSTYVKGCLTLRRGRELVQMMSIQQGRPGSEQLLFDRVSASELQDSCLTLDVWGQTSSSPTDRPLGAARMDLGSLWQPVLQMPNKWHDFSLPILANVNSGRI